MHDIADGMLRGATAGLTATVPMTLFMEAAHRCLPPHEQYPLPPREITERATEAAGVDDDLSEPQKQGMTLAAHFGYGASAGAVYGALAPSLPFSPALNGIAYGLAVWAGSYLGWLPAVGLHPPATREPARRNALMIGAHVLWGAVLGCLVDRLSDRDTPTTQSSSSPVTSGG